MSDMMRRYIAEFVGTFGIVFAPVALSATGQSMARLSSPQIALEMLLAFNDRIGPRYRADWYDDLSDIAQKAGQIDRACHYQEKSIEAATNEAIQTYFRLRYAEQLCLYRRPHEALVQARQCRINTWNSHAVIHHELVCGGAAGLLGETDEAASTLARAHQHLQETPYPGLNQFSNQLQQAIHCSG